MAKRKKYSATKCPEPLNTIIDLSGTLAMGAYAKHQVKRDYQRGQGEESIKAATTVYGMGAMRCGSSGLMSLGGLYGVNNAIRDIGKSEAARRQMPVYDGGIDVPQHKTNNNQYAWRLNCEDGSAFGVSPMDYETRDAYNRALADAKDEQATEFTTDSVSGESVSQSPFMGSPFLCCRVSRLDNGANEYYMTEDNSIKVGDTITVTSNAGTSDGVVIGIKRLSEMTEKDLPKSDMWILMRGEDDDSEN